MADGSRTFSLTEVAKRIAVGAGSLMGPGKPMEITAPERGVITMPYPMGWNMTPEPETRQGGVSFAQMRALADNHYITRLVIETCKDQVRKLGWDFRLRKPDDMTAEEHAKKQQADKRLPLLRKYFKKPDRHHLFSQWVGMILEEVLVTDSLAIYKRPWKASGDTWALEVIDGTTIFPLLDEAGRRPLAGPAYQQKVDGQLVAEFTVDELIYHPRNPRAHRVYGMSPIEHAITVINQGLRRSAWQTNYYTEGNDPHGFVKCPKEWTPEQIEQFQKYWNILMANPAERNKIQFIPDGTDPIFPTAEVLKDEFDEWIARVVCYAFSVSPNNFIRNLNRSTGEQQREQADEEGEQARKQFIKELIDEHILGGWELDDQYEFVWMATRAQDSLKQAEVDQIYISSGVKSIDEVRKEQGLVPIGVSHGVLTKNGFFTFDGKISVGLIPGVGTEANVDGEGKETQKVKPEAKGASGSKSQKA